MKTVDPYLEKIIQDALRMIHEGECFEGKSMLEHILTYEPGYPKVHNILGWLYMYYLEDDELAEMHLKLAIKFDPTYEVPYCNIAELYLRLESFEKLEALMKKAKHVKGIKKSMIYEYLGIVEEARGHYKLAIHEYRLAMFHSRDNYDIDNLKDTIKRCKFKRFYFMKSKLTFGRTNGVID